MNRQHRKDVKTWDMTPVFEHLSNYSLRTPSYETLKEAIAAHAEAYDRLYAFNSRKSWLRWQFHAKIAEQRTIYHVINHVLRGRTKRKRKNPRQRAKGGPKYKRHEGARLVTIGDGNKMHGIRGTSSGAPMSKIQRLATRLSRHEGWYVRSIDERYTSKRSSCCQGRETTRVFKDGVQVYGILACTGCGMQRDRDKSAARNQFHITTSILRNKPRPWWLTRENKPPQENPSPAPMLLDLQGNQSPAPSTLISDGTVA